MHCIIGVDIGTSGTKAVAFASSGEVLADAHVSYSYLSPKPGYHELDPQLLVQAVIYSLKNVIEKIGSKNKIEGISFSCAMHSVIALDKNGTALTNAITWADTRSNDIVQRLKFSGTGNTIYEHCGTPIHAMTPLCKIIWIKENEPELFAKTAKFIGIKEYVWFRFFEKYLIDYSLASATGLFDIRNLQWFEPALKIAGITNEHLSLPVTTTHIETAIVPEYKSAIGLKENIPFIIGASDGCLANLGSNAILPGDASLTIGTSGALRMVSSLPKHDSKERIFNYILTKDVFVSGGAVNNGAVVVEWFVKNFFSNITDFRKDFSAEVQKAITISPGADGLIFLPYLLGERAPVWDADARGVFFGINPKHSSLHFLRAVIEGISFSLYQVCVSLEETIGRINYIYASGGFTQSGLWLQMIADIFNKKIIVTNTSDASAIGAAIMGFYSLDVFKSLNDAKKIIKVDRVFEPDLSAHKIYNENFVLFTTLYVQLKDQFSQITKLQKQRSISE
ncbi:MAG: gluconokinase [Bacteroidetes bacterium]|nr:gluconokinase [Bacteroidota bacterium]